MEMEKRVPLSTLQSDHLAASWLEEGQRKYKCGNSRTGARVTTGCEEVKRGTKICLHLFRRFASVEES